MLEVLGEPLPLGGIRVWNLGALACTAQPESTPERTEHKGILSGNLAATHSSFQPAQETPIFAVWLAEFRHSPAGHAGGPHVVVTFPPALLNSPSPHYTEGI